MNPMLKQSPVIEKDGAVKRRSGHRGRWNKGRRLNLGETDEASEAGSKMTLEFFLFFLYSDRPNSNVTASTSCLSSYTSQKSHSTSIPGIRKQDSSSSFASPGLDLLRELMTACV
jgi:hypothetical protein